MEDRTEEKAQNVAKIVDSWYARRHEKKRDLEISWKGG